MHRAYARGSAEIRVGTGAQRVIERTALLICPGGVLSPISFDEERNGVAGARKAQGVTERTRDPQGKHVNNIGRAEALPRRR